MFTVNDILKDLQEVLGDCDQELIFRRLDAALDLLQPMLPTDSNVGVLDICAPGCEVTLPYYVEAPQAVNVGGHPADFRDKWYEHHMNGPGSQCCGASCTYSWQNQGLYPVFREMTQPSWLAAYGELDEGSDAYITIFGEDENGKPLYSCRGTSAQEPGLILPISYGVFSLSILANSPKIKRITQISKPKTDGFVRLIAYDQGRDNGTLIGYYRPDETAPAYRRLKITPTCTPNGDCEDISNYRTSWVRMRYTRRQMPITDLRDVIFVPSREAVINAVEAVHKYRQDFKEEGDKYLLNARAYLEEKQADLEGPNTATIQFQGGGVYGGDGLCNMV